jgi:hypothetical protein
VRSPRSACPGFATVVAFRRRSAVSDRPTSLNEVPRALRRTNSLFVPVSISSRLTAFLRAIFLRAASSLLPLGSCPLGQVLHQAIPSAVGRNPWTLGDMIKRRWFSLISAAAPKSEPGRLGR